MRGNRISALAVAATLGGAALMAVTVAPTASAGRAFAQSSAASCSGAPTIDLWYDSDQYGSYAKVSFSQSATGCSGPRAIEVQVFCQEPALGTVYQERSQDAAGPVQFPTGALPADCQQFRAHGVTSTPGYDSSINKEDSWSWAKDQFPA